MAQTVPNTPLAGGAYPGSPVFLGGSYGGEHPYGGGGGGHSPPQRAVSALAASHGGGGGPSTSSSLTSRLAAAGGGGSPLPTGLAPLPITNQRRAASVQPGARQPGSPGG